MADAQGAGGVATGGAAESRPLQIETNGINVITDAERKGHPRDLFWPWFAANISVLGLSYGAFLLAFGISFWQAVVVGLAGIVISFLLCGFIAIAGKRGSAPTMVLSRAAFGVRGNKLPTAISWLLTVGWETILMILATLAIATVFGHLGWGGGTATKIIAMIVVVALTIFGGVMGFDLIMRMQTVITIVTGVLTVMFIILVAGKIHWSAVSALPGGSAQALIGGLVFMMTGFGLGWVNVAADYSRYLPRRSSSAGVAGWTTFGSAVAPIILLIFGLLLAGLLQGAEHRDRQRPDRGAHRPAADLVPGPVRDRGRARPHRRRGAGHLLLGPGPALARPAGPSLCRGPDRRHGDDPRHDLRGVHRGQLLRPVRGLPDHARRTDRRLVRRHARRHRAAAARLRRAELYNPGGRYGDIRWFPVGVVIVSTVIGWGLVTNTFASWLSWQGYLLGPFGLGGKSGAWAFANLGVLVALVLGFVATWAFSRSAVRSPGGGAAWSQPPPRHDQPRRPGQPAERQATLAVIDMQRVFGERDSPWLTPRFAEIVGPIQRLVGAYRPRVIFTRFVAPDVPTGAWRRYYELWPFALQPPGCADLRARGRVRR